MNEYTIWQAASEKIAEVDENMRRAASEKPDILANSSLLKVAQMLTLFNWAYFLFKN